MPKQDVIRVEWVNEGEVHMYPPEGGTWWARPVPNLRGGELWELADGNDEVEGYYDTPDEAIWAVSAACDDLPVVTARER